MSTGESFQSIWKQRFDVAIYGAGFAGVAAALGWRKRGASVLLIEPSGRLLWEASSALEDEVNPPSDASLCEWQSWLNALRDRSGVSSNCLDTAMAEVFAAEQVNTAGIRVLFYSQAIRVEKKNGRIGSFIMAAKDGLHRLYASLWVDASETGEWCRLTSALTASPRAPSSRLLRLALHSREWSLLEQKLSAIKIGNVPARLRSGVIDTRRSLQWEMNGSQWENEIVDALRTVRQHSTDTPLLISHASARPFPVYGENDLQVHSLPENLILLSPAYQSQAISSLSERFQLGENSSRGDFPLQKISRLPSNLSIPFPRSYDTIACDVLVAGTGTAGAIASLAAAKNGACVHAIDLACLPGGVGTEGGINGYFRGVKGGLQSRIDHASLSLSELWEGYRLHVDRWHPTAKALALLKEFSACDITFHGEALLCGVEKESSERVDAVWVTKGSRLIRIKARAMVDATGDGDLCAQAGASFSYGREGDHRCLAYTQAAFYVRYEGTAPELVTQNFDAGWVDSTNPEDLSQARLVGLAQYGSMDWSALHRPAFLAALPGLRQSRQIVTDYTLTLDDLIDHTAFPDSIGQASSHADTHSVDYEFEEDEAAFYFWTCRQFRHPLVANLPYRIMLPQKLTNVWIACRAAGISPTASYAIRMQRDMQRMGEAAGIAAALSAKLNLSSRSVPLSKIREQLRLSGAYYEKSHAVGATCDEFIEKLASGQPGLHLWHCFRQPSRCDAIVRKLLDSDNRQVSFYAACVLAMWSDSSAEPRLLAAIRDHEEGLPATKSNAGAYGQEIDIPNWLLSVILLRRCGTEKCLASLSELVRQLDLIFNVRTSIAMTVERLFANHRISQEAVREIIDLLLAGPRADSLLELSRSTWRALRGEKQLRLPNGFGVDTRQDHGWQLRLVIMRIYQKLNLPYPASYYDSNDSRGAVRRCFSALNQQSLRSFPIEQDFSRIKKDYSVSLTGKSDPFLDVR